MFKRVTLYPFFFVLFAILSPLVVNMDDINPVLAVRPLVVLLLLAAGLILVFRAVFRDGHYAGYLTFLIFFGFLTYGHVLNVLAGRLPEDYEEVYPYALLALLAAALAGLGLRRTWRRLGGAARVTPFLNLVLAATLVSQAGLGLAALSQRLPAPGWRAGISPVIAATGPEMTLDCSASPDIYWIILDGYGRADVLEEIYDVDTGDFLESLEEMGFYIADQSHANYIQTVYSIPSALYFRYLEPRPANITGYVYFPELVAKNRLAALLRQCGYQTVAFESGFRFTSYPSADVYLQYGADRNEFEGLLLANTPLDLILSRVEVRLPPRSYGAHRARVRFAFEKLAELPEMPGPQFVYAHIISPHPPFIFDAEGNSLNPRRGFSLVDGSDYKGSWAEYKRGYAGQVQNVNRLVERTVSAILENSPTPPVIIIQGDHGPGGHLEWKSPDRSCLWERTPILLAYYLPDAGGEDEIAERYLYPEISPVNTFRVVLNAYFGQDLELLPDKTYFTSARAGGAFIDITARRESKENCD